MTSPSKLIVASTRLPITMLKRQDGWVAKQSAGGLVTALKPVREARDFEWIGWCGTHVSENEKEPVRRALKRHGAVPVFISKSDTDGFYSGFSNGTLWPLFHGLTDLVRYSASDWKAYEKVNNLFADEICARAEDNSTVWIHDYQLCLLPEILRGRGLKCPIGFFLHIPFPSSEIYRTLPVRERVLRGLLGADFLGFHAYEYISHFRKACLRVLGLESSADQIRTGSHRVNLGVLPIGIDPQEVREMATLRESSDELTSLKAAYRGKKIILGVDRLDYTKGIPEKLLAFEELLKKHPKWRQKCVLIQVAAPSRESVTEYQTLRSRVNELVGRINGRFGSPNHTPIVYINQSVNRTRLIGMYQAADIALITPIKDGMNLVALEYIAARGRQGGSLIFSEFAGAAYLLPGARLVNPYNVAEVAKTLEEELESDTKDSTHMLQFVNENTSNRWASEFLQRLESCSTRDPVPTASRLRIDQEPAISRVSGARKPLIMLDYDGTLRGYELKPMDAIPNARIRGTLRDLAALATVYVISGRSAETLEKWLGDLPIGFVCEHGYAMRPPGGEWETRRIGSLAGLKTVLPLFEEFCRRTPGSLVERKRASVAWHYRMAEPELGVLQANELHDQLEELLRRKPYTLLRGNRVLEVRHAHSTKGNAAAELLDRYPEADMVLCAGDDRTDEDMMEIVREQCIDVGVRVWVGGTNPTAEFWTDHSEGLLSELDALVQLWQEERQPKVPSKRSGAAPKRGTRPKKSVKRGKVRSSLR